MAKQSGEHDVRFDRVGLSGRARFSCYTPGCNTATLIHQPYMSVELMEQKVAEFLEQHPCSSVVNEGWRG
jgi:hypothetical protein